MTLAHVQAQVDHLLNSGVDKATVFRMLTAQHGLPGRRVAWCIAAHTDDFLIDRYGELIDYLVWIVLIQSLAGAWLGYQLSASSELRWLTALVAAVLPIGFAWGFFRNSARAYNLYLLFAAVSLLPYGLLLVAFPCSIGLSLLSLHLLASVYVWFVRSKIFPDFGLWGPRRIPLPASHLAQSHS